MNSLYFLHIPKTAGTYITNNIIENIAPYLYKNNIKILTQYKNNNIAIWHGCWDNRIDKNTYIISSLRDPVKRTISHYCNFYDNDDIDLFLKWKDENYLGLQNFQSKSIVYEGSSSSNLRFIDREDFKNLEIDNNLLYSRLNRINLIINKDHIDKNETINICNKILNDFKLNEKINDIEINKNDLKSLNSKKIFLNLSQNQIYEIQEMNNIDMKIWKDFKINE